MWIVLRSHICTVDAERENLRALAVVVVVIVVYMILDLIVVHQMRSTSNRNIHGNEITNTITSFWRFHRVLIKILALKANCVFVCVFQKSSDLSNKHIILKILNDFLRFNKRKDLALAKAISCIWCTVFAYHKSKLMIWFSVITVHLLYQ